MACVHKARDQVLISANLANQQYVIFVFVTVFYKTTDCINSRARAAERIKQIIATIEPWYTRPGKVTAHGFSPAAKRRCAFYQRAHAWRQALLMVIDALT